MGLRHTPGNGHDRRFPVTGFRCQVPRPVGRFGFHLSPRLNSIDLRINFLPSQPRALLASPLAPTNATAGHPGFLLQTVTCFLRPGFPHYYGVICHLTPLRSALSFLLYLSIHCFQRNGVRLPQLLTGPCKQLHPQSRHESDQELGVAIFCTLAHSFRRIRFACAVCHLPPIASFRPHRCQ